MAQRWIVTALGEDRPGIVAGVTEVLYRLGCNLEDSAMTRLEGEFAIMLIFSAARSLTVARLEDAFQPLTQRLKLVVHVKRLSTAEARPPAAGAKPYMISVYGADQAGIVFRVSQLLAKLRVNISDVETHRSGNRQATSKKPSLYLMLLAAEAPARLSAAALERQLKALGRRLGVQVTVRPAEPDVL